MGGLVVLLVLLDEGLVMLLVVLVAELVTLMIDGLVIADE